MRYFVKDWGEGPEQARVVPVTWDKVLGAEDVALFLTEVGEDIFHNRDGWESSWPLEVGIIDDEGTVFECCLEMEAVPSFSGEVKEAAR